MRLYSVHLRQGGYDPESDLILVKQGFSWPALVFTVFWALWSRMWWPALGLFAALALATTLPRLAGLADNVDGLLGFAVALAVGLIGNDLRRWSLDRAGYDEVAVVSGNSREEATRRFLDAADIDRGRIYL